MGEDFAHVLARFETWMQLQGWSDRTRHGYRYELVCFACDHLWLAPMHVGDVTRDDVLTYLGRLPANGSKRGDALRALKALYGFLDEEDPTEGLRGPRSKL